MKRAFKAQEKEAARSAMLLEEEQLNELLDHLDARLVTARCDHSLRLTSGWAEAHDVDADRLAASLRHFGGYCDCEVLANVEPDSIF